MLSQNLKEYAQCCWQREKRKYGAYGLVLEQELSKLIAESDEQVLLMLLYGTLPASDLASVPTEVLMSYIRHALMLRKTSRFCRDIPEDSFIHFVFYPRINSEDLCDCREFFHDRIAPRLEGRSPVDAALEVNRWCAENMTYEMSDSRTENPLTAYLSGLGRCGEESTFAVAAFRSVGIPARQIYVPYWVHCDDNHAWVEVQVEGRWYFLGACEPEPVLNRGWFTDASSRAPLALGRSFLDYVGEGLKDEAILEQRGCTVFFNVIPHYAPVTRLMIRTVDASHNPIPQASIRLEVPNMAAFRPVVSGRSDQEGIWTVVLGRADFYLQARAIDRNGAELICERKLEVRGDEMECRLILEPPVDRAGERIEEADYIPPMVTDLNRTMLTEEQKLKKAATLSACETKRISRIESYFLPEYQALDADWQEILHLAGGNAAELYELYQSIPEEPRECLKKILHSMTAKDYRDVKKELLYPSLSRALDPSFREESLDTDSDMLRIPYLANPRIRYEQLEDWRPVLEAVWTESDKAKFRKKPDLFWRAITERFPNGDLRWYPVLCMLPSAVEKLKVADEKGRKIYFVAGMRTFGVPARMNPIDEEAEYWKDGTWYKVSGQRETALPSDCEILLLPDSDERFVYKSNFTLSRLEHGVYQPLDYSDSRDSYLYPAVSGSYRLLTTNRLPNGSQLVQMTNFMVKPGERKELILHLRQAMPEEMLNHLMLEPFAFQAEYKEETSGSGPAELTEEGLISSDSLLTGPTLIIYPMPGEEPTEHLMNEMLDVRMEVQEALSKGLKICMVSVPGIDTRQATYQRVLEAFPQIQRLKEYRDTSVTLARTMFQEPGVWPLLVLTDQDHVGTFASCGYRVGSVELILKLVEAMKK